MVRGISKKEQKADLLRKRRQASSGLPTAAKVPPKVVPVPSASPRPPARPAGRREK
jgi:hypothetical protein